MIFRHFSIVSILANYGFHAYLALPVGSSTVGAPSSGRGIEDRSLLELPPPLWFYENQCTEKCTLNSAPVLLNACPKCPERYNPCNSCCFGGATSLKFRFHGNGCPGTFSMVLPNEHDPEDCSIGNKLADASVKFIDCSCFDTVTQPGSGTGACASFDEFFFATSEGSHSIDFCLVSVSIDNNLPSMNLTKPLPSVIGIRFEPLDEATTSETFFDTTCIGNTEGSLATPLFPGYGKFTNTCPYQGFIDLGHDGVVPLPPEIDHYFGEPPLTMTWFEFLDGTSAGFWNESIPISNFDPTFAQCSCVCDDQSSFEPSLLPSMAPSVVGTHLNQGPGIPPYSQGPASSLAPSAITTQTPPAVHPSGVSTVTPSTLAPTPVSTTSPTKQPEPPSNANPTNCNPGSNSLEPSQPAQKGPGTPDFPSMSPSVEDNEPSQAPSDLQVEDCDDVDVESCFFLALNGCRAYGNVAGIPDGALCVYPGENRKLQSLPDFILHVEDALAAEEHSANDYRAWIIAEMKYHIDSIKLLT